MRLEEWAAGLMVLPAMRGIVRRRAKTRSSPRGDMIVAKEGYDSKMLSADEIERYARHIVLREVGGPGQAALKEASVLVIGAGGLGAPALVYLAARRRDTLR